MSWTSLNDSGMLRLLWIILGLTGWLSVGVNGLKCYICDMGMEGCLDVTTLGSYLKDCAPSAIACASLSGEKRYTGELWFQRLCLYPSDLQVFRLDANNLPNATEGKIDHFYSFVGSLQEANEKRTKASLPPLALPFPGLSSGGSVFQVIIQTCNSDGCNDWQLPYKWKYADGYPADTRSSMVKLTDLDCLECHVNNPYHPKAYTCLQKDPDPGYHRDRDIWFISDFYQGAHGCTTIAIYQTSKYGLEFYFERNYWVPGDYWCLLRKYKSSLDRSSYVQYSRKGDSDGEDGEENKGSCRAGYLRSLEQEEAEAKYSWVGQRVFQTVDEFSDFLKCKEEVREKTWWSYLSNPVMIPFNETAVRKKIEDNYSDFWTTGGGGPFAYVGFRFCGPDSNCNSWSAEKLYSRMDEPPTTTTSTTTTTHKTTTTTPTTTPTTAKTTTPSGDKGTVYPGEIPDEGCKIKPKNEAGQVTGIPGLTFFLLILNILF